MELVEGCEYKLVDSFSNLYGQFDAGTPIIYKGRKWSGANKTIEIQCFETKVSGKPVSFIEYEDKVEENINGKNIKRGHFIIGTVHKNNGAVSFASQPKVHESEGVAIGEARRLAVEIPEKKFMVVEVKAIARTTDVVVE